MIWIRVPPREKGRNTVNGEAVSATSNTFSLFSDQVFWSAISSLCSRSEAEQTQIILNSGQTAVRCWLTGRLKLVIKPTPP